MYSVVSKPFGLIPISEDISCETIPASTSVLEIAFGAVQEIALEFLGNAPDSKVVVAATETAANTAIAANAYHARGAGDCRSYYRPAVGGSVFVKNNTAVAAVASINASKIGY